MSNIDSLDRAILELLHHNARLSSAEVARRVGSAARTVQHRIQRMIALGVFQPLGVIAPAYFGYTLTVDIYCEVEVGYQQDALEAIMHMPNVTYAAISTGDQDINLQVIFRNSAEMHAFITDRLHALPGMRRTRTVLLPRVLKDTYQWQPSAEDYAYIKERSGGQEAG
ncbi:MAG: Lrp/AsnC family transcriptional regulator [Chloroflexi bacterium]|nr:Lrp/AsnC family transcriptional regulator [Chloroflexota bacterium]